MFPEKQTEAPHNTTTWDRTAPFFVDASVKKKSVFVASSFLVLLFALLCVVNRKQKKKNQKSKQRNTVVVPPAFGDVRHSTIDSLVSFRKDRQGSQRTSKVARWVSLLRPALLLIMLSCSGGGGEPQLFRPRPQNRTGPHASTRQRPIIYRSTTTTTTVVATLPLHAKTNQRQRRREMRGGRGG